MDPLLIVMGGVDVLAGLVLLGITGDMTQWLAYALLFKGGLSLLSMPW